jgi:hypothetical protein
MDYRLPVFREKTRHQIPHEHNGRGGHEERADR